MKDNPALDVLLIIVDGDSANPEGALGCLEDAKSYCAGSTHVMVIAATDPLQLIEAGQLAPSLKDVKLFGLTHSTTVDAASLHGFLATTFETRARSGLPAQTIGLYADFAAEQQPKLCEELRRVQHLMVVGGRGAVSLRKALTNVPRLSGLSDSLTPAPMRRIGYWARRVVAGDFTHLSAVIATPAKPQAAQKRRHRDWYVLAAAAVLLVVAALAVGAWLVRTPSNPVRDTIAPSNPARDTHATVRPGTEWNVRRGPGMSYPSIGVVQSGQDVTVACAQGSWIKITSPMTGFVYKNGLTLRTNPEPC